MTGLFNHVLLGLSGGESSLQAAKYAIAMAKFSTGQLTAVYVVDTATIRRLTIGQVFVPAEASQFQASLEEDGRRYLNFISQLAETKGVILQTELRHGPVGGELLAAAAERHADCLVLGSWEPSHAAWDIPGSNFRELLQHARCPILIVRDPDIESMWARV